MLLKKLAFVNIETTGSSLSSHRAIEIGIVRVDDGNVRIFQRFVDRASIYTRLNLTRVQDKLKNYSCRILLRSCLR